MQRYLVYCGVLILGSPCVLAGTATATLNVTATVISACSVSVPTNVAFGNYNPASGSPTNTTGTLNVTCTSMYAISDCHGCRSQCLHCQQHDNQAHAGGWFTLFAIQPVP
ncbi:spore coat protein U domain-containing protein [Laribacter hongkongensis]|uniref:spore coat protein U domain-containing protein n=1 Tax=Laribacter hongkongensis TaxID=168471 RepID=UPI000B5A0A4D